MDQPDFDHKVCGPSGACALNMEAGFPFAEESATNTTPQLRGSGLKFNTRFDCGDGSEKRARAETSPSSFSLTSTDASQTRLDQSACIPIHQLRGSPITRDPIVVVFEISNVGKNE